MIYLWLDFFLIIYEFWCFYSDVIQSDEPGEEKQKAEEDRKYPSSSLFHLNSRKCYIRRVSIWTQLFPISFTWWASLQLLQDERLWNLLQIFDHSWIGQMSLKWKKAWRWSRNCRPYVTNGAWKEACDFERCFKTTCSLTLYDNGLNFVIFSLISLLNFFSQFF